MRPQSPSATHAREPLHRMSIADVSVMDTQPTPAVSPLALPRVPAHLLLRVRLVALTLAIAGEIMLLLIALVPQSIWASRGLPDGPIPHAAAPLVAALFYALPALIGLLSRRWQAAIVLATLPAWLDLGAFAVAAAQRIGPFYLAVEPHAISTVGTLELFAVLGALGWLARPLVLGAAAVLLSWRHGR